MISIIICVQCGSLKQCEAALEDWEADQQMSSSFFEQYVSQSIQHASSLLAD